MKEIPAITDALSRLERGNLSDHHAKVRMKKGQILLAALRGSKDIALSQVDSELGFLHPAARERWRVRILSF